MNKTDFELDKIFTNLNVPLVIVVSGPSGVGKDAVLNRMKCKCYNFEFIVTLTTRKQRASEKNGIDYSFISVDKFQELVKENRLLEWAQVYGNWYGVPKEPVQIALAQGKDVIIKVDVQGVATLKKVLPEGIFIFIAPPSGEELAARLTQRHTESASDLELRLKTAEKELREVRNFDYVVLNHSDKIDQTIEQIMTIIAAEKSRVNPRRISLF